MEKQQLELLIRENESLKQQVIDYSIIIKLLQKEKDFLTKDEKDFLNKHLKFQLKITKLNLFSNESHLKNSKRKTKNYYHLLNTVIPNQIHSIKVIKQILEKLDEE